MEGSYLLGGIRSQKDPESALELDRGDGARSPEIVGAGSGHVNCSDNLGPTLDGAYLVRSVGGDRGAVRSDGHMAIVGALGRSRTW